MRTTPTSVAGLRAKTPARSAAAKLARPHRVGEYVPSTPILPDQDRTGTVVRVRRGDARGANCPPPVGPFRARSSAGVELLPAVDGRPGAVENSSRSVRPAARRGATAGSRRYAVQLAHRLRATRAYT